MQKQPWAMRFLCVLCLGGRECLSCMEKEIEGDACLSRIYMYSTRSPPASAPPNSTSSALGELVVPLTSSLDI